VTAYILTEVRGSFACMTRLARVMVPGLPHHVTQRGNSREAILFGQIGGTAGECVGEKP
jgi:REP element-mobilizing transposase RayT